MISPEIGTKRRIHLLSEDIYNRIAAGEVVERPASVLKELVENSLDAGATAIEVAVFGAGRKEICVTDDGEGMGKEDLMLAFERHATSKVSSIEDLQAIHTLGFRGEALSAIASVARIEATSRLKDSLVGHRLRLHGGRIQEVEEAGAPEGTTLVVRDLFFNTPARKKFLKSSGVESGHLLNVFRRYALAYPEVRWSLNMDGKDLYRLPPESLQNRMLAVLGDDLSKATFPVQAEESNVRLSGFIGSAELARKSRGDQHLFINRRWVQNRLMGHAVVSAYGHLLDQGRFPFYILFLDIPSDEVDVNVHPAKSEVKFQHENEIYAFIQRSVADTLKEAGLSFMPEMRLQAGEKIDERTGEITVPGSIGSPSKPGPVGAIHRGLGFPTGHGFKKPDKASPEAYRLVFGEREGKPERLPTEAGADVPMAGGERTQVYQLHQRYIVTEIKGGIAIIDQHAAHERVLYEKALKALSGGKLPSQQLLFPKILELQADDAMRLREVEDELQSLGISIQEFGERSFVLESIPAGIAQSQTDSIVYDILDELKERGALHKPGQELVAAAFACRAAIKFGQTLTLAEMNALIDQLFATQFPFTCPHGRPTLLQLTLGELERRFGRA